MYSCTLYEFIFIVKLSYTFPMHSLILSAHPSPSSFTHAIAQAYREGKESRGNTALVIDLYDPRWKQEFLCFETHEELSEREKTLTPLQEEVKKADEIVFVFPVWWYDVPAILKNFIDCNLTSGFAFKFMPKGYLRGLLKPRTVRYFATAMGPTFMYKYHILPFAPAFRKSVKDCGLKTTSKTIFGFMGTSDQAKREGWLNEVRKSATG